MLDRPLRTVQYWCRTGRLKAQKVGRDWLIHRDDAEKFLAENHGKDNEG